MSQERQPGDDPSLGVIVALPDVTKLPPVDLKEAQAIFGGVHVREIEVPQGGVVAGTEGLPDCLLYTLGDVTLFWRDGSHERLVGQEREAVPAGKLAGIFAHCLTWVYLLRGVPAGVEDLEGLRATNMLPKLLGLDSLLVSTPADHLN